jgi:hypothetical protein
MGLRESWKSFTQFIHGKPKVEPLVKPGSQLFRDLEQAHRENEQAAKTITGQKTLAELMKEEVAQHAK